MNYCEPDQKWRDEIQKTWRNKTLLDVSEVAVILNKPIASLYASVKKGHIPHIRIGGSIKVPVRALAKMIDGK